MQYIPLQLAILQADNKRIPILLSGHNNTNFQYRRNSIRNMEAKLHMYEKVREDLSSSISGGNGQNWCQDSSCKRFFRIKFLMHEGSPKKGAFSIERHYNVGSKLMQN